MFWSKKNEIWLKKSQGILFSWLCGNTKDILLYFFSSVETLNKDYRTYHITCEEDISKHRGEMFLVDRSSMTSPLKILDIPLVKYQYGKLTSWES